VLAHRHTQTRTRTHTHTHTHTHTQVIKVTDEAITCPGCNHKSMMAALSLSALAAINRERDSIFEQRGGNDDEGEPALKRRRKNEMPLSMPFICQCATQALVNLKKPNLDECFGCHKMGGATAVEDPHATVRLGWDQGRGDGRPATAVPPRSASASPPLAHTTLLPILRPPPPHSALAR